MENKNDSVDEKLKESDNKSLMTKLITASKKLVKPGKREPIKQYQKYRYKRDASGKVIGVYGRNGWRTSVNQQRGRTLFNSINRTLTAKVEKISQEPPKPKPSQDLQRKRIQLQKQIAAQRQYMSMNSRNPNNRFERVLEDEQRQSIQLQTARENAECPTDFARRRWLQKKLALEKQREFIRRSSLLNAHKGNLTPKENAMDFLDEKDSILKAENLFSQNNPNRININKTNRPSILQTKEGGNNLQF